MKSASSRLRLAIAISHSNGCRAQSKSVPAGSPTCVSIHASMPFMAMRVSMRCFRAAPLADAAQNNFTRKTQYPRKDAGVAVSLLFAIKEKRDGKHLHQRRLRTG